MLKLHFGGELLEEIYMRAPPEFDLTPCSVLRLTKSVYGFKQSSKKWYEDIQACLLHLHFIPTQSDPCFFNRGDGDDKTYFVRKFTNINMHKPM
jgi:hypothetical protein